MANEFTLEVKKRDISNKSDMKNYRKQGEVPGIYYSHDSKNSIPFLINKITLREAHKSGARIFNITVGSKSRTVIFKSVQYHPVTDEVMHVDLYGVKMDQAVTVNVEIKLIGSAKGITEGGILVQGPNEIEIECLPLDIPEFIEVDISHLELGDSMRVVDLSLDEKLAVKSSEEQIVASVTHPMKEIEPEVIEEEGDEFMEEGGEETTTDDQKDDSAKEKSADDKNQNNDSKES